MSHPPRAPSRRESLLDLRRVAAALDGGFAELETNAARIRRLISVRAVGEVFVLAKESRFGSDVSIMRTVPAFVPVEIVSVIATMEGLLETAELALNERHHYSEDYEVVEFRDRLHDIISNFHLGLNFPPQIMLFSSAEGLESRQAIRLNPGILAKSPDAMTRVLDATLTTLRKGLLDLKNWLRRCECTLHPFKTHFREWKGAISETAAGGDDHRLPKLRYLKTLIGLLLSLLAGLFWLLKKLLFP